MENNQKFVKETHPDQISQRLFVVVGTPGSGKDDLIRAVKVLGGQHASIVPKHTSRKRRSDDEHEIICQDDEFYDLEDCDIVYTNYEDNYGIKSSSIWNGLKTGISQVVVVSNVDAINKLRELFSEFLVLVYVHSEVDADEYKHIEVSHKNTSGYQDMEYVKKRAENYMVAFHIFLENYLAFNHVLINSGLPEDLYDQIFRLFRAYERGEFGKFGGSR